MPLNRTNLDLVFTQGVDSKTDDKNTSYTSFQVMQNSRYSKVGAVVPRGAFVNFAGLPNPSVTSFDIIADKDYVVAKSDSMLYTISSTSSYSKLGNEMSGGYKRLYGGDAAALVNSVVATPSGLIVQAWATSDNATTGNIGIAVYDPATDRVITKGVCNLSVVQSIQLISVQSGTYLLYVDNSYDLKAATVSPSASTSAFLLSPTTWANSPTGTTAMRFAVATSGNNIVVLSSADNAVTVSKQQFTAFSAAPAASVVFTFATTARGLAACPVTTQGAAAFMVAATSTASTKAAFYTSAAALVGSQQTLGAGTVLPLRCWAYETATPTYGYAINSSGITLSTQIEATTSTIVGVSTLTAACLPVSGPNSSRMLVMDTFTETTYGSQGMVQLASSADSLVSTFGVGMNIGQLGDVEVIQLSPPAIVGTKTYFTAPVVSSIDGFLPPSGALSKTTLTVKTQASLIVWDSAELLSSYLDRSKQQALYIGATTRSLGATERTGTPWPELATRPADLALVAGGLTGTVSYVFAKVWKSAEGVEYRTYSTIYTAVLAAQTLQYTLKSTDFNTYAYMTPATQIEIYRTEENAIIFYLAGIQYAPGTYVDASLSAAIIGNRTADLNGNELPPQAVSSARAITSFADRIAMVTPDKPSTVVFDRPSSYPVGTSFANGLEVDISGEGGDITALQDMDSCLYIFKNNAVFSLYGDPAGATGENSSLGTPKILFSGIGCTDPRSAILTPKGILFKSGKGFYMLARNQALSFIGEGPFSDLAVSCTGAAIAQNQYEVYFGHANSTAWVLNLDTMAWYNWVTPEVTRGLTVSNGQLLTIGDARIYKYNEASSTDTPSLAIPQDIQTGWIRMGHIRGFQRIRRVYMAGSVNQSCQLTVQVYTDYDPTIKQTFQWNLTATNPLQLDMHMSIQKCEAMRFRFYCDKGALTLSGGTIEIGIKQGTDKSRSSSSNQS